MRRVTGSKGRCQSVSRPVPPRARRAACPLEPLRSVFLVRAPQEALANLACFAHTAHFCVIMQRSGISAKAREARFLRSDEAIEACPASWNQDRTRSHGRCRRTGACPGAGRTERPALVDSFQTCSREQGGRDSRADPSHQNPEATRSASKTRRMLHRSRGRGVHRGSGLLPRPGRPACRPHRPLSQAGLGPVFGQGVPRRTPAPSRIDEAALVHERSGRGGRSRCVHRLSCAARAAATGVGSGRATRSGTEILHLGSGSRSSTGRLGGSL